MDLWVVSSANFVMDFQYSGELKSKPFNFFIIRSLKCLQSVN